MDHQTTMTPHLRDQLATLILNILLILTDTLTIHLSHGTQPALAILTIYILLSTISAIYLQNRTSFLKAWFRTLLWISNVKLLIHSPIPTFTVLLFILCATYTHSRARFGIGKWLGWRWILRFMVFCTFVSWGFGILVLLMKRRDLIGWDPINALFLPRMRDFGLSCAELREMGVEQLKTYLTKSTNGQKEQEEIAEFIATCNKANDTYQPMFPTLFFHVILLCSIQWKTSRRQKFLLDKNGERKEEAQELIRFSKDRNELLEANGDVAFLSDGKGKVEIAPIRNSSAASGVGYSHI